MRYHEIARPSQRPAVTRTRPYLAKLTVERNRWPGIASLAAAHPDVLLVEHHLVPGASHVTVHVACRTEAARRLIEAAWT